MAKLVNLARVSTATTGTGTITLGSAVSGYLSFSGAGVSDGDAVAYGIKDGANSEVGYGTYTATGTTLSRNVTKSTNSDAAISLSGSAEVFVTARAEDFASSRYNVAGYGLKGDGKMVSDAVANATTTLTSATANFTSADVGKALAVEGAGVSSGTLVTTISSVTNSTTIVMANAASVSATGLKAAYGTDNTTALNSLISSFSTGQSAKLFFPTGVYCFTGQVTFTHKHIEFVGEAYSQSTGSGASDFTSAASVLVYLNTGSGNFLYGGSQTNGVKFSNFMFSWISNTFSGKVISFTNDGTGDPASNTIENCTFSPTALNSTATVVYLHKSLLNKILNCSFFYGGIQIQGGVGSGSGYLNGIVIQGCSFGFYNTRALNGQFSGAVISGNVFEQSTSGVGAAWLDDSAAPSIGVSWTGNWFGDSSSAPGGSAWIDFYGKGISIAGNTFGGTIISAIRLDAAKGFSITGNIANGTFTYFVNYSSATCDGGLLSGNTYHVSTSFEVNTANKGANVINTGNVAF